MNTDWEQTLTPGDPKQHSDIFIKVWGLKMSGDQISFISDLCQYGPT